MPSTVNPLQVSSLTQYIAQNRFAVVSLDSGKDVLKQKRLVEKMIFLQISTFGTPINLTP